MMQHTRREFLNYWLAAAAEAGLCKVSLAAEAESRPARKFTICLAYGVIGLPDNPAKSIERATQFGFESIEPSPTFLAKLLDAELSDYLGRMREAKLAWGA